MNVFIPKRLKLVQEEIALQHPEVDNKKYIIEENEKLHALIMYLAKLEIRKIQKEAFVLSREQISMIAGYIPHNYYADELHQYGKAMNKLFTIIELRSSEEVFEIIFKEWQEKYDNKECNVFLKNQLLKNKDFIRLILNCHFTVQMFSEILCASNILTCLARKCTKNNPNRGRISHKLEYYGIDKNSKLARDCEWLFYTYCDHDDYLATSDLELDQVISQYNFELIKQFITNFLSFMSIRELDKYQRVWKTLMRKIQQNNAHLDSIQGVSDDLIQKFNDWSNRCKIAEAFGNDERSQFWKQYQYQSVRRFYASNSVVMELEDGYIVEFLGTANGPAYVYNRENFETKVEHRMSSYDNHDLRQVLYRNPEWYQLRQKHLSSWQYNMDVYLKKNYHIKYVV